jgi:hypothetical protein
LSLDEPPDLVDHERLTDRDRLISDANVLVSLMPEDEFVHRHASTPFNGVPLVDSFRPSRLVVLSERVSSTELTCKHPAHRETASAAIASAVVDGGLRGRQRICSR